MALAPHHRQSGSAGIPGQQGRNAAQAGRVEPRGIDPVARIMTTEESKKADAAVKAGISTREISPQELVGRLWTLGDPSLGALGRAALKTAYNGTDKEGSKVSQRQERALKHAIANIFADCLESLPPQTWSAYFSSSQTEIEAGKDPKSKADVYRYEDGEQLLDKYDGLREQLELAVAEIVGNATGYKVSVERMTDQPDQTSPKASSAPVTGIQLGKVKKFVSSQLSSIERKPARELLTNILTPLLTTLVVMAQFGKAGSAPIPHSDDANAGTGPNTGLGVQDFSAFNQSGELAAYAAVQPSQLGHDVSIQDVAGLPKSEFDRPTVQVGKLLENAKAVLKGSGLTVKFDKDSYKASSEAFKTFFENGKAQANVDQAKLVEDHGGLRERKQVSDCSAEIARIQSEPAFTSISDPSTREAIVNLLGLVDSGDLSVSEYNSNFAADSPFRIDESACAVITTSTTTSGTTITTTTLTSSTTGTSTTGTSTTGTSSTTDTSTTQTTVTTITTVSPTAAPTVPPTTPAPTLAPSTSTTISTRTAVTDTTTTGTTLPPTTQAPVTAIVTTTPGTTDSPTVAVIVTGSPTHQPTLTPTQLRDLTTTLSPTEQPTVTTTGTSTTFTFPTNNNTDTGGDSGSSSDSSGIVGGVVGSLLLVLAGVGMFALYKRHQRAKNTFHTGVPAHHNAAFDPNAGTPAADSDGSSTGSSTGSTGAPQRVRVANVQDWVFEFETNGVNPGLTSVTITKAPARHRGLEGQSVVSIQDTNIADFADAKAFLQELEHANQTIEVVDGGYLHVGPSADESGELTDADMLTAINQSSKEINDESDRSGLLGILTRKLKGALQYFRRKADKPEEEEPLYGNLNITEREAARAEQAVENLLETNGILGPALKAYAIQAEAINAERKRARDEGRAPDLSRFTPTSRTEVKYNQLQEMDGTTRYTRDKLGEQGCNDCYDRYTGPTNARNGIQVGNVVGRGVRFHGKPYVSSAKAPSYMNKAHKPVYNATQYQLPRTPIKAPPVYHSECPTTHPGSMEAFTAVLVDAAMRDQSSHVDVVSALDFDEQKFAKRHVDGLYYKVHKDGPQKGEFERDPKTNRLVPAKGRTKGTVWYPEQVGQTVTHGKYTITLKTERQTSVTDKEGTAIYGADDLNYIERTMVIKDSETGKEYSVRQFHTNNWLDCKAAPSALVDHICGQLGEHPVVSHCSAGVGRSGVILVKYLLGFQEKVEVPGARKGATKIELKPSLVDQWRADMSQDYEKTPEAVIEYYSERLNIFIDSLRQERCPIVIQTFEQYVSLLRMILKMHYGMDWFKSAVSSFDFQPEDFGARHAVGDRLPALLPRDSNVYGAAAAPAEDGRP